MEDKFDINIGNGEADENEATPADNWELRFLRLSADFENYRKRVEAERLEQTKRIRSEILKSVLPVYDDFRHMLDHAEAEDSILAGVDALQKSWEQWMQQNGMHSIGKIGETFDYSKHEAVLQETVDDPEMDGKITRIIKYGYEYDDVVLRHAQVAVGRYKGLPAIRNEHREVDKNDI